jgi:putative heme iron utilization protein
VLIIQSVNERKLLRRMNRLKKEDEQKCRERIVGRCQSAKPSVALKKLTEIKEVERHLRKRGKTA